MIENLVVGLIVAGAACYAVWRWMPAAWRRGAAALFARGSARVGLLDAERAQRLQTALSKSSGCGACDSCGACASPKAGTADPRRPQEKPPTPAH
ncbi:conserved hypothetical protein [Burkholderiales bacterium 8X]|nr:conserved hypothetical protein [Burkholderiales bacterium 8X]